MAPDPSVSNLIGFGPASVSATNDPLAGSTIPRSTRYFAKHLTPFPHICANVPSEFM